MYVDEAKSKSVLFSYTLHPQFDPNYNFVRLQGLDSQKLYKVEEINKMSERRRSFEESGQIYSGDFLMKVGLKVSASIKETSVVLEILEVA